MSNVLRSNVQSQIKWCAKVSRVSMKQSGIPEKLIFEQSHVYRRVCTAEKYWISVYRGSYLLENRTNREARFSSMVNDTWLALNGPVIKWFVVKHKE